MGHRRMISDGWKWAAAKAAGTSHLRAGEGSDDFGGCALIRGPGADTFVLAASDGAGSAQHSAVGSRLATLSFVKSASEYLRSGGDVSTLTRQTALEWLDAVRDRIFRAAETLECGPRDLATTLVGCLVAPHHAACIHVGDGAMVFRFANTTEWQIGSWPTHGEYASTTYFVTDDPEPNVVVSHIEGEVKEVSVFTDGLERLVLEFATQTAFTPFFDRIFAAFKDAHGGRDRQISEHLRRLLESRQVCDKTDDDKTLLLAKRV
jgi:hypothetical protein